MRGPAEPGGEPDIAHTGALPISTDATDTRPADTEQAYQAAVLRAQLDAGAEALLIVSADRRVVGFTRHFGEIFQLPEGFLSVGEEVPGLMAECRKLVRDPEEFTQHVRWAT